MSDAERATLDAMRAREDELEGVLAAQEDALRAHQAQVWEHQAARARMQAEWDALQGRVRAPAGPWPWLEGQVCAGDAPRLSPAWCRTHACTASLVQGRAQ